MTKNKDLNKESLVDIAVDPDTPASAFPASPDAPEDLALKGDDDYLDCAPPTFLDCIADYTADPYLSTSPNTPVLTTSNTWLTATTIHPATGTTDGSEWRPKRVRPLGGLGILHRKQFELRRDRGVFGHRI